MEQKRKIKSAHNFYIVGQDVVMMYYYTVKGGSLVHDNSYMLIIVLRTLRKRRWI